MMFFENFLLGITLSFGLFSAIGMQNVFVIKQGLMNNHLLWVLLLCIISDIFLLSIGILGIGSLLAESLFWSVAIAILGICFLCGYGALSLKSAYKGQSGIQIGMDHVKPSLAVTLLQTLAVTYLNPGTYVDIVVLLGGIASQLEIEQRMYFLAGSICASFLWFGLLGFGSKILRPLFASPKAWRILDIIVAVIMFSVAFGLLQFVIQRLENQ